MTEKPSELGIEKMLLTHTQMALVSVANNMTDLSSVGCPITWENLVASATQKERNLGGWVGYWGRFIPFQLDAIWDDIPDEAKIVALMIGVKERGSRDAPD